LSWSGDNDPRKTMKPKTQKQRIRLQFDFSPMEVERIDALKDALDAASRAELIRRSLKLMEFAITARKGAHLILRQPDGTELLLEFL
jgi:hypothetical protein